MGSILRLNDEHLRLNRGDYLGPEHINLFGRWVKATRADLAETGEFLPAGVLSNDFDKDPDD